MITIKTPQEIKLMQEGGRMSSETLHYVLSQIKEGITTMELERMADNYIKELGGQASFRTVDDYKYATCININAGIVHGLPSSYKIKQGDLVSIDLGVLYKGFHTDVSYTVEVGTDKEKAFLEVGKRALAAGIFNCIDGGRLGDIGAAMQQIVEKAGYTVSRELVGHGVGRELHEDPYVPGYGTKGKGLELREGMVLAIEIIYQKGAPKLALSDDGWTLETADKSLSALFEETVAITKDGPLILTSA